MSALYARALNATEAMPTQPLAFFCLFGLDRPGGRSRAAFAALMGFNRPWTLAGEELVAGARIVDTAMRDALEYLGVPVAVLNNEVEGAWRAQVDWGAAMVFIPLATRGRSPLDLEILSRLGPEFMARAGAGFMSRLGRPVFSATQWRSETQSDGGEATGGRVGLLEAFGARSLQAVAPTDERLQAWESVLADLKTSAERHEICKATAIGPELKSLPAARL